MKYTARVCLYQGFEMMEDNQRNEYLAHIKQDLIHSVGVNMAKELLKPENFKIGKSIDSLSVFHTNSKDMTATLTVNEFSITREQVKVLHDMFYENPFIDSAALSYEDGKLNINYYCAGTRNGQESKTK